MDSMKLVLRVQLLPDPDQNRKLRVIVEQFNGAANFAAGIAFEHRTANVYEIRKHAYAEIRERFGLSSQMAQLAIKVACDAYRRDKSIKPAFRPDAAVVYDQRTMSFKGPDRVSLLTLEGRVVVPFVFGKYYDERFKLPKGQSDLVRGEDGKWFLLITVDVPEVPIVPTDDFLGIDMGIANIAVDSDPETEPHSGDDVEKVRRRHNLQRKRLQRRGTKGAKKKLRRISGKEARFKRHTNHVISKTIVTSAQRTGRGIAIEDLGGIRERVTARGTHARNRLSGWSFGQLYAFLAYKAELAGVPVETVDPRNTSRTCAECGHCSKSNRKSQAEFACKVCGHRAHADKNAARNIRARALAKRAPGLVGLTV